jgi:hypothetical protein
MPPLLRHKTRTYADHVFAKNISLSIVRFPHRGRSPLTENARMAPRFVPMCRRRAVVEPDFGIGNESIDLDDQIAWMLADGGFAG